MPQNDTTEIPDFPPPDRLMSSVMSMAQDAVARVEELRMALERLVYETTHLSPCNDDGSHNCQISGDALRSARKALVNGEQ